MAATFTYDETLTSTRDYLRFRIDDTQSTYRKFYNEELDAILTAVSNDVDAARGMCFSIMAQDPDRLMLTKDGAAGAFTLLALMNLYAQRAAEYYAS